MGHNSAVAAAHTQLIYFVVVVVVYKGLARALADNRDKIASAKISIATTSSTAFKPAVAGGDQRPVVTAVGGQASGEMGLQAYGVVACLRLSYWPCDSVTFRSNAVFFLCCSPHLCLRLCSMAGYGDCRRSDRMSYQIQLKLTVSLLITTTRCSAHLRIRR